MRSSLFSLVVAACMLCACQNDNVKNAAPPAPVRVATVERGNLTRAINAVGNVEASASIDVIPRVNGQITTVHFREGDEVKEGQPLLQIDARPYAAVLAEKKANLAKSEAQLAKAARDRQRYGLLVKNGYISREAYDQTVTDAAALQATVKADRAAVDLAALDLAYCTIKAPVSGRIGPLKLQRGTMVKGYDTGPIVTIDTIAPCRVIFSVPEQYLPAIQKHMRQGQLHISATPGEGQPEQGIVTLIDNNVDTQTGAIALRGEFDNAGRELWPGHFVQVNLPLGEIRNALIVPRGAVQTGRDENYVYVIDADNKAQYRKIKVIFETDTQSAVSGELQPGERVVIDGQVRLAPGVATHILD